MMFIVAIVKVRPRTVRDHFHIAKIADGSRQKRPWRRPAGSHEQGILDWLLGSEYPLADCAYGSRWGVYVKATVREVFERPTIAEIAELLNSNGHHSSGNAEDSIIPLSRDAVRARRST